MATTTRDYYQALGVDRSAGQQDIQRAYRRLARRYHPDLNKDPGAEERFKQINEAYAVLSDPKSRLRYDRYGERWRQIPQDHDSPVSAAGPAGAPGGGARRVRFGAGGFDDLLGGLFSGGLPGSGTWSPAPDAEVTLELSVEEACTGGRRRITLQTVTGPRSYDIDIPAGVTEGQRIRLVGQGAGGGPYGDLSLVVRLAPHPRYRVDGRDVTVALPVAPWEAALGASVPVDTPGGPVQVRVPAGSSTGRRLRLRGRGMPHPHGSPGDLYAEVKVVVPAPASAREQALWRRLAEASEFDARGHVASSPDGRP
ncbi:DnaJ C-terminal domain-containing protein [Actinoplanes sp. CA-252034]|uniref:DnaJ C-terminal domain-containing protein n=1 Tax=Actinoplanes sp. CA-252034 TaxID=3239906 RepID=UPI003D96B624